MPRQADYGLASLTICININPSTDSTTELKWRKQSALDATRANQGRARAEAEPPHANESVESREPGDDRGEQDDEDLGEDLDEGDADSDEDAEQDKGAQPSGADASNPVEGIARAASRPDPAAASAEEAADQGDTDTEDAQDAQDDNEHSPLSPATTSTATTTMLMMADATNRKSAGRATPSAKLGVASKRRPRVAAKLRGRIREHERLVEFEPKLRVLNQVEICDVELLVGGDAGAPSSSMQPPKQTSTVASKLRWNNNTSTATTGGFIVSWIDRIGGDIQVEWGDARAVNCELRSAYELRLRALACNGLASNE